MVTMWVRAAKAVGTLPGSHPSYPRAIAKTGPHTVCVSLRAGVLHINVARFLVTKRVEESGRKWMRPCIPGIPVEWKGVTSRGSSETVQGGFLHRYEARHRMG